MHNAGVVGDDEINVAHVARRGSRAEPIPEPSQTVASVVEMFLTTKEESKTAFCGFRLCFLCSKRKP